jgi:hypothetical protein
MLLRYASSNCAADAHETMFLCSHKDGVLAVMLPSPPGRHNSGGAPFLDVSMIGLDPNNILRPPKPPSLQQRSSDLQEIAAWQPQEEKAGSRGQRLYWEGCQLCDFCKVVSSTLFRYQDNVESKPLRGWLNGRRESPCEF